MKKTVCELFAGVGGFRLGLEQASDEWETVWFSQWEPGKAKQWAHECYTSHWGDIDGSTNIDIALVPKNKIPDHNLLVGGFPCQDYSVARSLNGSKGIQGKKGVLWWQIRDVLEEKSPPFVLLENVDRLIKSPASQRGRDFGIMLSCFALLNYSVEWRVINAADYGAPQRRRRVFIFAYKNDTSYAEKSLSVYAKVIITKSGFFSTVFPIAENDEVISSDLNIADLISVSENFQFNFLNAGYMRGGFIFTSKVTPKVEQATTLGKILEQDVPEKYYIEKNLDKWKYLKGAKKITRTAKTGHNYTFSEGAIPFPDSLDLPARTMLTSESSVNRSSHLIKDPQTGRYRILTPVEAERLQGFDDDWTDTGMPERYRYFCMGNALVVPLITRMSKHLNVIFEQEDDYDPSNSRVLTKSDQA